MIAVRTKFGLVNKVLCSKDSFVVNGSLVFKLSFVVKVPPFL